MQSTAAGPYDAEPDCDSRCAAAYKQVYRVNVLSHITRWDLTL
jgi:hypothetical protein